MGKINPNMVPIMNLKNLINFEERYLMWVSLWNNCVIWHKFPSIKCILVMFLKWTHTFMNKMVISFFQMSFIIIIMDNDTMISQMIVTFNHMKDLEITCGY